MNPQNLADLNHIERTALADAIDQWLATSPGVLTKAEEYKQGIYQHLYDPELMKCLASDPWLLRSQVIASRVSAELAV